MGMENHRQLSHLPHCPPVRSARNARFLVSWWEQEVHVWKLRKSVNSMFDPNVQKESDLDRNRKLLKTIMIDGDSNIASAAIDSNGSLLAVSTATAIKVFHLRHDDPQMPSEVSVSTLTL